MVESASDLKWHIIRHGKYELREHLFSVEVPDVDHLIVDKPVKDVKVTFQKAGMRPGWFLSYHYHDEDANLATAFYKDDEYNTYQFHVRVIDSNGPGCKIYPHTELCPMTYPKEHLRGVNTSVAEGIDSSRSILDENGINTTVSEG